MRLAKYLAHAGVASRRAAEAMVLGRAGRLSPGGLRAAIARAVIEVAPDKARQRREDAVRDARVERWPEDSGNAALAGREPRPFVHHNLGVLASLGHARGIGSVLGLPLRGVLAWWVRRTYYLFQMPRWSRRVRIVADWTLALFFRPDIVKVDLASEGGLLQRDHAAGANPERATAPPP